MSPRAPDGPSGAGPPPLYLGVRQTHKGGERGQDCQDAWWAGAHPARVAMADGATRAFFAREWAWLVAEHFCRADAGLAHGLLRADTSDAWRAALAPVRAGWREAVGRIIQRSHARELLQNRFQRRDPAVATLVGVELDAQGGGWRAVLIGDSCLMRFDRRTGAFLRSDPVDDPARFDNHPEALISEAGSPRETAPRVVHGAWGTDQVLVLATDALAKWLLELAPDRRLGAAMELLDGDEAAFDARVAAARRGEIRGAPPMEDDDVTLLVVACGEPLRGTRPFHEVVDALPPPLSPHRLGLADPDAPAGQSTGAAVSPTVSMIFGAAAVATRGEPQVGADDDTEPGHPHGIQSMAPERAEPAEMPAGDDGMENPPAGADSGFPAEPSPPTRRGWRVAAGTAAIVGRLEPLGTRRLAILALVGWTLLLGTVLRAVIPWPGGGSEDERKPPNGTVSGSEAAAPSGNDAAPAGKSLWDGFLPPFSLSPCQPGSEPSPSSVE